MRKEENIERMLIVKRLVDEKIVVNNENQSNDNQINNIINNISNLVINLNNNQAKTINNRNNQFIR